MAKKWEKILVVDLEATCDKNDDPNEIRDIIEVGICSYNTTTDIISQPISYIVKPERCEITEYCQTLTGITPKKAKNGLTFQKVCEILEYKWGSKNNTWAAYGGDADMFRDQCADCMVKYPFGNSYIDVARFYAIYNKKSVGLQKALKKESLEFVGRQHSGADDAYNTAILLQKILKKSIIAQ